MSDREQAIRNLKVELGVLKEEMQKYTRLIVITIICTLVLCLLLITGCITEILRESELLSYIQMEFFVDSVGWITFWVFLIGLFFIIKFTINLSRISAKCNEQDGHIAFLQRPETPQEQKNTAPNTWTCSCGRVLKNNISSCVCGVSKRQIKMQDAEHTGGVL